MSQPAILIAEDNRVMADVVRFNLERAGFRVTLGRDGVEALEHATRQVFDLVLTDSQMPRMDGQTLCQSLRERPEYANTPIIMCSAKGYELDPQQLKTQYGIDQILLKPFSPKQVVDVITERLAQITST